MNELRLPAGASGWADDGRYPAYAMGPAAEAIGVTPAFLRSVETAGLFAAHRSGGGHRRYSRDDLQRADRARRLVDDGMRLDAAVQIVRLEYQLAAANTMIEILRARLGEAGDRATPPSAAPAARPRTVAPRTSGEGRSGSPAQRVARSVDA